MRVLLASDGSDGARAAAELLKSFPLPASTEALVLSVAPNLAVTANLRAAVELQRALDELAARSVREACELLGGRFHKPATRIAQGDPRSVIVQIANEWDADMIVLGARGLGRISSFLLGSVSLGVARHAHRPVLIAKGEARQIRHVVVGIDGSDSALAAARFLARLPLDGVTIDLISVLEHLRYTSAAPELTNAPLSSALEAATDELENSLRKALDQAKGELAGAERIGTTLVRGAVRHELVHACYQGADLLVVGAQGTGAFERLLLGSVSEAALCHAPCSVLVEAH